jgi:sensor histidine kinase YesM
VKHPNNAVTHACGSDSSETITVVMRYDIDFVEIELREDGSGFDPDAVPEPNLTDFPKAE